MEEGTTRLLLNAHDSVTYCILPFSNQSNEVSSQVTMGNTNFLTEVPVCSVRQDLTRSWFIISVIINEREVNTLVAYLLWG